VEGGQRVRMAEEEGTRRRERGREDRKERQRKLERKVRGQRKAEKEEGEGQRRRWETYTSERMSTHDDDIRSMLLGTLCV